MLRLYTTMGLSHPAPLFRTAALGVHFFLTFRTGVAGFDLAAQRW